MLINTWWVVKKNRWAKYCTDLLYSKYKWNHNNDVLFICWKSTEWCGFVSLFTLCICNCCSGMLIMAALWNRAGHYIFALLFILSSSFFSCLISAVADWMYIILPHMVWPWDAGVKCTARCSLKIQNAKNIAKKSPSGHHHNFVRTKACNEFVNFLKTQYTNKNKMS